MNTRRRPNRSAIRPENSISPANVSAYAVSTHCTPESVKPSSRRIVGMAVSTIVASKMTMKKARPSRPRACQRRGSAVAATTGGVRVSIGSLLVRR